MPNNLTPEQLARLAQLRAQAGPGQSEMQMDGRSYIPQFQTTMSGGGENADMNSVFNGWRGYDFDEKAIDNQKSRLNGVQTDYYDPLGQYTQSDKLSGLSDHNSAMDWGPFAMAAIPFALAAAGAAAAGGAGAAGAGGAGAGAAGSAVGPGMAGWGADLGISSASGLGGGAASGLGAGAAGVGEAGWGMGLDSMAGIGGGSGAEMLGGAGAATGGGAGAWTTAAADSQAANAALGLGPVGGATAPAIASGLGGGGSSLSGLLGSGKDLLGMGSTVLGALSGAQGQESEQSTRRDIPEWLKPYVQKNLNYAGGLLDQQMAPGAMPGWEQMRNKGMGLLSTPQVGNGFNRFFPGK